MTSIEAILLTLLPTVNMFWSAEIILKTTIYNKLSKSQKFSRAIFVEEFQFGKPLPSNFIAIVLMIVKLIISWTFIMILESSD